MLDLNFLWINCTWQIFEVVDDNEDISCCNCTGTEHLVCSIRLAKVWTFLYLAILTWILLIKTESNIFENNLFFLNLVIISMISRRTTTHNRICCYGLCCNKWKIIISKFEGIEPILTSKAYILKNISRSRMTSGKTAVFIIYFQIKVTKPLLFCFQLSIKFCEYNFHLVSLKRVPQRILKCEYSW